MLIPWSAFWDQNYFVDAWPALGRLLTNNYTRGGVTGLGLLNIWAALAELADAFAAKSSSSSSPSSSPNPQSPFDNHQ